jgi:hypothetical protein
MFTKRVTPNCWTQIRTIGATERMVGTWGSIRRLSCDRDGKLDKVGARASSHIDCDIARMPFGLPEIYLA